MADQSVRACHPSKFYYFRRSLLISCCYILSPFTSPSSSLRIPITLPSPFTPFSPSLSHVPLGSPRPLPPLFISLLFLFSLLFGRFHLRLPVRHEKKIREREKGKKRGELYQRVIIGERNKTATESRARLFWFRGCCLFAPLYFIANLSALPSISVPTRLLASS